MSTPQRLILLVAGRGTRLGAAAQDKPKCLVPVAGKPLISWQISLARARGIKEIVLVRGFRSELLDFPGVRTVENKDFATTNMAYSLWCAREFFNDDFILAYGDIVYTPAVFDAIVAAPAPVSVVVDREWKRYWEARFDDVLSDAETLKLDSKGRIVNIGQKPTSLSEIEAQYIGLLKFSGEGRTWLREILDEHDRAFREKKALPHSCRGFEKLYMTDVLQELIDRGRPVAAVPVDAGWMEFDREKDVDLGRRYAEAKGEFLAINRAR